MPDPKLLKVGDKIRLLCVPEGDLRLRDERIQAGHTPTDTVEVIERIIKENPIVEVDWIDKGGIPWYSRKVTSSEGVVEDHSLAIYKDESWELVPTMDDKAEIDEFDSPWKEALEFFFAPFMLRFFPRAHAQIDWNKPHEFLDSELQQIMRDAEKGRCHADKLIKVWLKNGTEQWIVIHIEIQGQKQKEFAPRMYVYNYRAYDVHTRPVASFALLTDDHSNWHPRKFEYEVLGCNVRLKFPSAKLSAFRNRRKQLQRSRNPIDIVILAHLMTVDSRGKNDQRMISLRTLLHLIHKNGLAIEIFRELFRLLDWMMRLPAAYKPIKLLAVKEIEEKYNMPFVSVLEEAASEKALAEAVKIVLLEKFNSIPSVLVERIAGLTGEDGLNQALKAAVRAKSLKQFERSLENLH